jgi:hypothetical protein
MQTERIKMMAENDKKEEANVIVTNIIMVIKELCSFSTL